jgi:hypothetical protein
MNASVPELMATAGTNVAQTNHPVAGRLNPRTAGGRCWQRKIVQEQK